MLGLGAAGIVWRSQGAVRASTGCCGRSPLNDRDRASPRSCRRSGRFRSTRSPARCPRRARPTYRLTVDGLVDKPTTFDPRRPPRAAADRPRAATSSASPAGGCPTCPGSASSSPTCSIAPACSRPPRYLRFTSFDGDVHREPHARPGPPARRDRRPRRCWAAGHPRARRAGAALRRADVRLQVAQVARPASRWSTSSTRATGRQLRLRRRRVGRARAMAVTTTRRAESARGGPAIRSSGAARSTGPTRCS